ncbi:MAG: PspC domain-containing protein [Oscillochloris sp.]|nr:PspC domain-containing protein [Oscillochloris sp.]
MDTRLARSSSDKMLGGVCGGLARYFNIDATLVRLVFVLAVLSGLSPLIYIILWIVLPQDNAPVKAIGTDPTGEWQYDPYTGDKIQRP